MLRSSNASRVNLIKKTYLSDEEEVSPAEPAHKLFMRHRGFAEPCLYNDGTTSSQKAVKIRWLVEAHTVQEKQNTVHGGGVILRIDSQNFYPDCLVLVGIPCNIQ